jgi:hypothetical protein
MPDQVRHDDYGTFYEFVNLNSASKDCYNETHYSITLLILYSNWGEARILSISHVAFHVFKKFRVGGEHQRTLLIQGFHIDLEGLYE